MVILGFTVFLGQQRLESIAFVHCTKSNKLLQLSSMEAVGLDCKAENKLKSSAYCHLSSTIANNINPD